MADMEKALDELIEKASVIEDYCNNKTPEACDEGNCPFSHGKYCLFDEMGMGIPIDWKLDKEI